MEEEDEDDIYAPDESILTEQKPSDHVVFNGHVKANETPNGPQDEESGEEIEEDESDSDIDIITEKKDEPRQSSRVKALKPSAPPKTPPREPAPARHGSPAHPINSSEREIPSKPGSSYPAVKTSTVDVDTKPIYEPSGKPITEVDMDADFPDDEKPWRRPGTDMTDYFNYGFDEFTWANYCLKQQSLRKEVADSKKQLDDMQSFMSGGMPQISGMTGAPGGAMPQMSGMGDIPPEMQQMFGQMMAQGIDPSQMDPATFMQMMSGAQAGQGVDPNHAYSSQGYGQQQQMSYGYGGGAVGGGGNQGGRGRRGRW